EIQASRARARVGADGEAILLFDQNRALWDHLLIRRGLAALARAEALGGAGGWYAVQAAIAACLARALTNEDTDWPQIVRLYDVLLALRPSPVVELNRAVAVSMVEGPHAALAIVDRLADAGALSEYPFLAGVRADLLAKLDRFDEASREFERAAS